MATSLASRVLTITIIEDDLGGDPARSMTVTITATKIGAATTTVAVTQSPPAGGLTSAEVAGWQALAALVDENITAIVADVDALAVEADA